MGPEQDSDIDRAEGETAATPASPSSSSSRSSISEPSSLPLGHPERPPEVASAALPASGKSGEPTPSHSARSVHTDAMVRQLQKEVEDLRSELRQVKASLAGPRGGSAVIRTTTGESEQEDDLLSSQKELKAASASVEAGRRPSVRRLPQGFSLLPSTQESSNSGTFNFGDLSSPRGSSIGSAVLRNSGVASPGESGSPRLSLGPPHRAFPNCVRAPEAPEDRDARSAEFPKAVNTPEVAGEDIAAMETKLLRVTNDTKVAGEDTASMETKLLRVTNDTKVCDDCMGLSGESSRQREVKEEASAREPVPSGAQVCTVNSHSATACAALPVWHPQAAVASGSRGRNVAAQVPPPVRILTDGSRSPAPRQALSASQPHGGFAANAPMRQLSLPVTRSASANAAALGREGSAGSGAWQGFPVSLAAAPPSVRAVAMRTRSLSSHSQSLQRSPSLGSSHSSVMAATTQPAHFAVAAGAATPAVSSVSCGSPSPAAQAWQPGGAAIRGRSPESVSPQPIARVLAGRSQTPQGMPLAAQMQWPPYAMANRPISPHRGPQQVAPEASGTAARVFWMQMAGQANPASARSARSPGRQSSFSLVPAANGTPPIAASAMQVQMLSPSSSSPLSPLTGSGRAFSSGVATRTRRGDVNMMSPSAAVAFKVGTPAGRPG
eukprot:TRINITY_DN1422_c0_g1_i1.p1 TRINITY_DN1422_c0_g1~~TRINITY_DN1422_c0_g1_i1.p1  ORF type:complete len:737 (+),score=96.82 TRINITY_DN1422_c0_g1_i1:215-2212(+)